MRLFVRFCSLGLWSAVQFDHENNLKKPKNSRIPKTKIKKNLKSEKSNKSEKYDKRAKESWAEPATNPQRQDPASRQ